MQRRERTTERGGLLTAALLCDSIKRVVGIRDAFVRLVSRPHLNFAFLSTKIAAKFSRVLENSAKFDWNVGSAEINSTGRRQKESDRTMRNERLKIKR